MSVGTRFTSNYVREKETLLSMINRCEAEAARLMGVSTNTQGQVTDTQIESSQKASGSTERELDVIGLISPTH